MEKKTHCDGDGNDDGKTMCHDQAQAPDRPGYAMRQSPLVQPHYMSRFAEMTMTAYSPPDLAHEWIKLFQVIGGGQDGRANRGNTMKIRIPDTIFLSPTGQPSIWYVSSSSSFVNARHLSHASPQAIWEAFTASGNSASGYYAIERRGFDVTALTKKQFRKFCDDMERAHLPAELVRVNPYLSDIGSNHREIPLPDRQWVHADEETAQSPRSSPQLSPQGTSLDIPTITPFCLQRYIPRERKVSYLCIWRQSNPTAERESPCQPNAGHTYTLRSPRVEPKRSNTGSDEIFLLRPEGVDGVEDGDGDEDSECICTDSDSHNLMLVHLKLGEGNVATHAALKRVGVDTATTIPHLFHMKLLTAEIMSRLNRGAAATASATSESGGARQVIGLACEYCISAHDRHVYLLALAGIQWQAREATWYQLRDLDPVSQAIATFFDERDTRLGMAAASLSKFGRPAPRGRERERKAALAESLATLSQFNELNPRFPSVQSSLTREQQWRFRVPLLPPHVAPRYVGTEMPRRYRDGQFQPLLSPRQCDATTRLNYSPHPRPAVQKPLSKEHADLEREQWTQQNKPATSSGSVTVAASPRLRSPRSPRPRKQSMATVELH